MKKNKNFAFGFTIAELLITMLITTVVAAALVPVIGMKKVKFPRNKYNHGVFECYYAPTSGWDGEGNPNDWQLMSYYADNGKHKDARPTTVDMSQQEYCTFDPPNADHFEIIVIGAGTDGWSQEPVFNSLTEMYTSPKPIHVDGRFTTDIYGAKVEDAHGIKRPISGELLKILNKWSNDVVKRDKLYAEYVFQSPIGKGGDGVAVIKRTSLCDETTPIEFCRADPYDPGHLIYNGENPNPTIQGAQENKDWYFLHGKGADSGEALKTHPIKFYLGAVHIKIDNDASHLKYEITGGRYGAGFLELTAAKEGGTPVYNPSTGFFDEDTRTASQKESKCKPSRYIGEDLCNKAYHSGLKNHGRDHGGTDQYTKSVSVNSGEEAKRGVIYYPYPGHPDNTDSAMLEWTIATLKANPESGYAGQTGSERTAIYERLAGRLYLKPAKWLPRGTALADMEKNITWVRENPIEEKTTLVSAASATKHGELGTMSFAMSNNDIPIPRDPLAWAKPLTGDVFSYVAKLKTTRFGDGLRSCDEDLLRTWCPGFAGKGVYFWMREVPDVNAITLKNKYNDETYSIPTQQILEERNLVTASPICDDKVTPALPMASITYTHANENGNLGTDTFTPYYCKEPKTKGSPGAVIILW